MKWSDWKELLGKEFPVELIHSLLHFGFEIDCSWDEAIDRLCLYLKIADRHSDFFFFDDHGPGEFSFLPRRRFGQDISNYGHLRTALSQKAFQMLSQNFFKNTAEKYYIPSWVELATEPQALSELIWFFRLSQGLFEERKTLNLYHDKGHNAEIAAEFAQEFSLLPWKCDELETFDRLSDKTKDMLRQAKPSMIEILLGLGKLDLLLREGRYERLDKECMSKLKDLALGFKLDLPDPNSILSASRKPETIKEACLGRSQAAQVFLLLQIMQEEGARLDKLSELKQQVREAEKGIQSLAQ